MGGGGRSFFRSILSRIVNNVSGERLLRLLLLYLFSFFPPTIRTARRSTPCWLIETVVEGTIACNCSFRETEAPFRFLRTMARSAFRSLRSRQVFSPLALSRCLLLIVFIEIPSAWHKFFSNRARGRSTKWSFSAAQLSHIRVVPPRFTRNRANCFQ